MAAAACSRAPASADWAAGELRGWIGRSSKAISGTGFGAAGSFQRSRKNQRLARYITPIRQYGSTGLLIGFLPLPFPDCMPDDFPWGTSSWPEFAPEMPVLRVRDRENRPLRPRQAGICASNRDKFGLRSWLGAPGPRSASMRPTIVPCPPGAATQCRAKRHTVGHLCKRPFANILLICKFGPPQRTAPRNARETPENRRSSPSDRDRKSVV